MLTAAIGHVIRTHRKKRGETITDLSEYERGIRSPNLSVLQRIADAFGLSLGDFFDEVDIALRMLEHDPQKETL
jgi:transcriptional regulator with XRE-family HTH domain